MPTYEYRCPKGHEFEVVQRMTGRPRTKCPRCGRIAERQMSGGATLIFKGSGFYITDYGKDGKGPRKEPEGDVKKPEGDAKQPDAAPATAKEAPASKPEKPATDKPARKKAKPSE